MHIYTHNAIHIYCLYIYILHTDANLVVSRGNRWKRIGATASFFFLIRLIYGEVLTSGWEKKKVERVSHRWAGR